MRATHLKQDVGPHSQKIIIVECSLNYPLYNSSAFNFRCPNLKDQDVFCLIVRLESYIIQHVN